MDAEVAKLIATDEEMSRKARVLASIPGIAQVTAAGLLSEMPELGRIDAKAAASLAGLAPVTRESGEWKANRRPSPSPAIARRDGFAMPVSNPSAPTDEHPKARYPGLGEHPQRNTSLTTWILTFSLDNARIG